MLDAVTWDMPALHDDGRFLKFLKQLVPNDMFMLNAIVRIDDTLKPIGDGKWKFVKKNFAIEYMVMRRTLCYSPILDKNDNLSIVYRDVMMTKKNMHLFYEPVFAYDSEYDERDTLRFPSLDDPMLNIKLDMLGKDTKQLPLFKFACDGRCSFLQDDGSVEKAF